MVLPPMPSREDMIVKALKDLHDLFGCGVEVTEEYVRIKFPKIEIKSKEAA